MKHLFAKKSLAAAAVVLGTFAVASSAQARSEVYFTIGVQVPGVYVQATPMYVQPMSYYPPAPVYYERHNVGRRHDWHHWQRRGPYGDRDRDGIMNRRDHDRDGDGVPNRFDRLPDNPYRR
jgi:hypothetical protein